MTESSVNIDVNLDNETSIEYVTINFDEAYKDKDKDKKNCEKDIKSEVDESDEKKQESNDMKHKELTVKIKPDGTEIKSDAVNEKRTGTYGFKPVQIYTFFSPPSAHGGELLQDNPESRGVFIRTVFTILLIMLIATTVLNFTILINPNLRDFFIAYGIMVYVPCIIIMIGIDYAMVCSACTRQIPCNIVCLVLTVLAMTGVTGYVTARREDHIIILALIATSCVVFVCLGLACTSFDFTKFMIYIVVISLVFFILMTLIYVVWLFTNTYYKPLHIALLFGGTILQAIILIMQLQTILGGKTVELNEDDYALGAFMLYTSIISIFIHLVQLTDLLN